VDREIHDFLYLNEELDVLDQHISLTCNNQYMHFILFPFMSLPAMYQKAKNLDKKLNKIEIFEEGLESNLSQKEFRSLQTKHLSVKNFSSLLEEYSCV